MLEVCNRSDLSRQHQVRMWKLIYAGNKIRKRGLQANWRSVVNSVHHGSVWRARMLRFLADFIRDETTKDLAMVNSIH
jgi:hypothetical protein